MCLVRSDQHTRTYTRTILQVAPVNNVCRVVSFIHRRESCWWGGCCESCCLKIVPERFMSTWIVMRIRERRKNWLKKKISSCLFIYIFFVFVVSCRVLRQNRRDSERRDFRSEFSAIFCAELIGFISMLCFLSTFLNLEIFSE